MQWRTKVTQKETLIAIGVILLVGVGIPVFLFCRDRFSNSSPIIISDIQLTAVTVPFTKLTQGKQSAIDRRVNYVLTSSAQLSELWKTVNAKGLPPKVDFKTHAVIAIFAGNVPSSAIAVAKIEDTNTRTVSIAITKPEGECAQKQSTASPYEIVAVPTTSLPLAHKDLATTVSCPN